MTAAMFWADRFASVTDSWWDDAFDIIVASERRRKLARFNTGSISAATAVTLRALCAWLRPKTVIEVGTFIGVSTLSLRADQIYTCDVSNDCLPSREGLTCHPYQTSTKMLTQLRKADVKADFWFVDGLLTDADFPLMLKLSTPGTVYAFDDFNYQFKGVQNVAKMAPMLPDYVLMPPDGPVKDDTTLAALVPKARL